MEDGSFHSFLAFWRRLLKKMDLFISSKINLVEYSCKTLVHKQALTLMS